MNQSSFVRRFNSPHSSVRLFSLGGWGDVTQNMFVYEYIPSGDHSKSQIIIVDCGVGFPEEDAFGVDLRIPDTKYLEDKKDRILGIYITHGHEDHIGALRFILPLLGKKIPVFAPQLAASLISARLAEFNLSFRPHVYDGSTPLVAGPFIIDPIFVTHSIPDTFHLVIRTPIGVFYHGSDYKFDLFPLDGKHADLRKIAAIGSQPLLCLLSDCLGADHEGFSPSESTIAENFEYQIKTAPGRVFVTSISSNIIRWSQAIDYGLRSGRKIVVVGYSVQKAIDIAKNLGYIKLASSDLVPPERLKNFADNKLLILTAGFAGQPDSALSKIVMGKHKIRIKSGDKVIFSSPDYIPGTTTSIYNLIDNLSRLGALVAYSEKEELHVSGHGYQKEHALLIRLLNPRYILPIGGNYRHIRSYQSLAKNAGIANDQLISPDYDSAITFYANGAVDTNFHLPLRQVLIDGLGVGDVGTTVLRDRKLLSQDGMFAIVLLIDSSSGQLFKPPSILSRGFVFVRESQELMEFLKTETVSTFNQATSRPPNLEYIRQQVQSRLEELILAKTGRQPMVLPLVIEV